MTIDYPDWMAPGQQMLESFFGVTGQVASMIATGSPSGAPGGVPLLNLFKSIGSDTLQVINGGASRTVLFGAFNQPYFEGYIQLANQGAANTLSVPVTVLFRWQDAGGNDIEVDKFTAYAGQQGNFHFIGFHGPNKADACTVTIINGNATAGNSIIFSIFGYVSSRPIPDFTAYSLNWEASPYSQFGPVVMPTDHTVTPSSDIFADIASSTLASINAATNTVYLLPLMTGQAFVQGSTSSGTTDFQVTVSPASDALLAATAQLVNVKTDATGLLAPVQFFMPPVQCTLTLHNANAAAKTCGCTLTVKRP